MEKRLLEPDNIFLEMSKPNQTPQAVPTPKPVVVLRLNENRVGEKPPDKFELHSTSGLESRTENRPGASNHVQVEEGNGLGLREVT